VRLNYDYLRVYRDYRVISVGGFFDTSTHRSDGAIKRGVVREFSPKSRKRLVQYLSSCVAKYQYMGTLTVRESSGNGRAFKRDLNNYLRYKLRRMHQANSELKPYARHEPSILWFLEFQARGAPHVHYLYTHAVHWQPLARYWAECVGQPEIEKTSTKFEKLRAGRAGSISYARKYASKSDQKLVPDGYEDVGRFWGVRGLKDCLAAAKHVRSHNSKVYIETKLWDAVKTLQKAGKIRVVRWKNNRGFTAVAVNGQTLHDIGLVQVADTAMLMDSGIRVERLAWLNNDGRQ